MSYLSPSTSHPLNTRHSFICTWPASVVPICGPFITHPFVTAAAGHTRHDDDGGGGGGGDSLGSIVARDGLNGGPAAMA